MAAQAEAVLHSRRPASDGSDPDSDPDIERGIMLKSKDSFLLIDDVAEPLLHGAGKAHASPAPNGTKAGSFRSDSAGSAVAELQLQLAKEDGRLEMLKSVIAILVWYSSNIGLLLLNKYMLSGFGFRRPVFLTLWWVSLPFLARPHAAHRHASILA